MNIGIIAQYGIPVILIIFGGVFYLWTKKNPKGRGGSGKSFFSKKEKDDDFYD